MPDLDQKQVGKVLQRLKCKHSGEVMITKKNTLKIENMICSTLRAQVGKTAWEAWVLETPLEDIKTEVERVALMVKSSQS